ncbi:MAG TPA: hypothetical protein DDW73_11565 [Rhizobium sp.]|nr:hypothetical protein [Rhizobium sp.]
MQDFTVSSVEATLAFDQTIEGWMLPAGVMLRTNRQLVPTSTIFLDADRATSVRGRPLKDARLTVDSNHKLIGFSDAVLATDLRLGGVSYPVGKRVKSKDWGFRDKDTDSLIFSPVRGQAAKVDHHPDVPFGRSVLQTMTGNVQAIVSNQEAGILDLDDFTLIQ